jgi:O-antigen ligase
VHVLHRFGASFLDFIENTRLGSAAWRLARFGIFALGVFVVSKVASGQFLSFTFADILFMAITAVFFLLVFMRWEIGIALILATTSFIAYYDAMPTLSLYHFIPEIAVLEHLRLLIGQGLILFLLALFVTSLEARSMRERLATPMTPAVLVFLLVILIASIMALTFGRVSLPKLVETSRPYSFYLMFFVTLLCVRGRRELRALLTTALVMASIVAILMFVQFVAGDRFKVFLGQSVRVEQFGGFAGRILPPGTELIWMTVPFVIARIPIASKRVGRLLVAVLGLLLGGLLLTFTRSVWMGTLLSMSIMAILGRGAIRRGVLRMFVALGGFVALLLVVLNLVSTERENYMTPYVKRFTSIFNPDSYAEGTSAGARWEEISAAWPRIVENPWLGLGPGTSYMHTEAWDDYSKTHYMRGVSYIHNAYVLLLTQSGALGLITCMIMYVVFFVRARKIFHSLDSPEDRSIVMAAIGGVASVMLASIMQPSLWYPPAVPCIGILFGLVELIRFLRQRELGERQASDDARAVARLRRGGSAGVQTAARSAGASVGILPLRANKFR